jgi:hypothetical protein
VARRRRTGAGVTAERAMEVSMSWALVVVVIVTVALIVLVAALYWYGSRLKHSFDAPSPAALAAQPPLAFTLSQASADSLAHLSREPILIRQAQDGLRVQLDNRPLVPIAILTDRAAAAALREIVAHASQRYGACWTALVMPGGDGSVSVQRLA